MTTISKIWIARTAAVALLIALPALVRAEAAPKAKQKGKAGPRLLGVKPAELDRTIADQVASQRLELQKPPVDPAKVTVRMPIERELNLVARRMARRDPGAERIIDDGQRVAVSASLSPRQSILDRLRLSTSSTGGKSSGGSQPTLSPGRLATLARAFRKR